MDTERNSLGDCFLPPDKEKDQERFQKIHRCDLCLLKPSMNVAHIYLSVVF